MDADCSDIQQVTANQLIEWQPAWSPNGAELIFVRGPGQTTAGPISPPGDLWIVDVESGEERRVTSSPNTYELEPQWSQRQADRLLLGCA